MIEIHRNSVVIVFNSNKQTLINMVQTIAERLHQRCTEQATSIIASTLLHENNYVNLHHSQYQYG